MDSMKVEAIIRWLNQYMVRKCKNLWEQWISIGVFTQICYLYYWMKPKQKIIVWTSEKIQAF
jgi:hypothetical protein